jgi:hypothetical protein
MATRDRFAPNNALPLFLSDRTEEPERSVIMKIAVVTTIVFVLAAAAIGFAIVGNPLPFLANAKASQVSTSSQAVATQSTQTIQSPAGAPASPPSAREASTGDELITAFKNAFEGQAEVHQPPAGDLFNQFQTWAAEEDAQAQIQPPRPVRDARAQVVQKARPPLPKPRPIQSEQAARVNDSSLSPVRGFGWRD